MGRPNCRELLHELALPGLRTCRLPIVTNLSQGGETRGLPCERYPRGGLAKLFVICREHGVHRCSHADEHLRSHGEYAHHD